MSKLTLSEAIKHCLEVAEKQELFADDKEMYSEMLGEDYKGFEEGCLECAADHRQLAKWLMELKDARAALNDCGVEIEMLLNELREAKRLLKLAVEDLNAAVDKVYNGGVICECCKWINDGECCCPDNGGCDTDYRWRYADEAKKLLNDEK